MLKLKQALVGTSLGRAALEVSRHRSLKTLSPDNPEQAAVVANGIIAGRLITGLCPDNGGFLDVGAHIGSVFSGVHHAKPNVKIFAVEAEPEKAELLKRRHPYCTVLPVAVGEQPGTATFYLSEQSGYNSLVGGNGRRIEVPVSRLDDLLPDQAIDLIKMDIEGAELGALRGGTNLFERGTPTVMFESTGRGTNALGYSPTLLWEWFNSRDYLVFTPDRVAHDAPPMVLDVFLDAHEYPVRTHNFFAVHKGKRIEVRDKARAALGIVLG